jgi:lysophospholipase L1-like esterase
VASGQPQQTSFEETNLLLQELFESLQRVAPLIVMSAVPIDESRTSPFLGKWFFRSDDAREMVKIVSDVATKSSVPYIPIYETFVTRNDLNELLADGLHCNVMGHDVLFQAVQKFLETRFIPS